MTNLQYPIGPVHFPAEVTGATRSGWIDTIAATPARLRGAVAGLTASQLDTPYRPSGWTVRQVVHHLPDSHLNAYLRCKLALTEEHPTVKAYDEGRWAELPDSAGPIEVSLSLLDQLHLRWVNLLRALPEPAFARTCVHSASGATLSVDRLVATYAWHGSHHLAHLTGLRHREGW